MLIARAAMLISSAATRARSAQVNRMLSNDILTFMGLFSLFLLNFYGALTIAHP